MPGLRLELEIEAPSGCPVVASAEAVDCEVTDVTWSDAGESTVEQFALRDGGESAAATASKPSASDDGLLGPSAMASDGTTAAGAAGAGETETAANGSYAVEASERSLVPDSAADGGVDGAAGESEPAITPRFEREDETVYEFERPDDECACERIELAGYPIADVSAADSSLFVTLYLDANSDVGGLLADVEDVSEAVRIRSVGHAGDAEEPDDLVAVDRGRLTDRQREVLETANAMGYFEYPRGANASEVAEALDICPSTLAEHLAAAQTKLMDDLLDGEPSATDGESD